MAFLYNANMLIFVSNNLIFATHIPGSAAHRGVVITPSIHDSDHMYDVFYENSGEFYSSAYMYQAHLSYIVAFSS